MFRKSPDSLQEFRPAIHGLFRYLLISCFSLCAINSMGQSTPNVENSSPMEDSSKISFNKEKAYMAKQRDLIDLGLIIIGKNPKMRLDSNKSKTGHFHISGAPSPSYSLATGFGFNITANAGFYTSEKEDANISSILISPLITAKKQFAAPLAFSIWTKENKYNIVGDLRFLAYPEDTYGLGGLTQDSDAVSMNYDYVRAYAFVLRQVYKQLYAGLGFQVDKHWNIQQINPPAGGKTAYDLYGGTSSSLSSGIAADILIDTRKNSINPEAGSSYGNIVIRQNLKALGSDGNWSSLLIDLRKYIRLSDRSNNILALWSYNYLTLNGKPPYLDLPSNGWDTYGNTGRGYVQSRFRSQNMIDFEAEYRFGILNNGLLGGVVFGNLETYSEYPSNKFESLLPGYGAGLRIKFNKFPKTNICFDYAFGLHGSNGVFVNLGEVF